MSCKQLASAIIVRTTEMLLLLLPPQVRNELDGLTFTAPDGTHVAGSTQIPAGLQNDLGVAANVLVLLSFTGGTRLLAFVMTDVAARLRFL